MDLRKVLGMDVCHVIRWRLHLGVSAVRAFDCCGFHGLEGSMEFAEVLVAGRWTSAWVV